jgi:hypothetical protein
MKNLFITLLFVLLTSCAANSTATPEKNPEVSPSVTKEEIKAPDLKGKITSCTCVKIWMPVCGENKKTYGNSCEADCAGVKYTAGECKKTK